MNAILLPTLPCAAPLPEVTLFGFDPLAFPFQHHVQAHLVRADKGGLVLPPGPEGAFDEAICDYGTVLRLGDTFHMWYVGNHGPKRAWPGNDRQHCRVGYATSPDGVQWERPELGLVEFNGSRRNNLVALEDPNLWSSAAVIHDTDDADPSRRFKMAYLTAHAGPRIHVAFSPDGLRWTPYAGNPVAPHLEMSGLTKFRGVYYLNGQAYAHRPNPGRRFVTYASADFVTWSPCGALTLERSPDLAGPSIADHAAQYEEVHLGAGLWNRGNVILGIYGQWHGHPTGDRRLVSIDLGLAVSHDALHFHEPIPGFRIIPARENYPYPVGVFPALAQGQGMENVGDRTLYWYSLWRCFEGTGVRLATWERDRLGMLKPFSQDAPRAVSCPIRILGGAPRLFLNCAGLGPHTALRVSLLDEGFRPLEGYSGSVSVVISENGFKVPVAWSPGAALPSDRGPVRVEIRFEGVRPEDARLHAAYVS
jgi:hypothetical protein